MNLQLDIYRASADEKCIFGNLLQLYLYEFSALTESDVEDDGRFLWDESEKYWDDNFLYPYLIKVNTKLAGLALIQQMSAVTGDPNVWDMKLFFVVEKYRRRGVGSTATSHFFREFAGPWEIRVLKGNDRALEFWRHAISLKCAATVQPVPTPINDRIFDVFTFDTS
jgi:predicted acetyltransferase